MRPIISYPKDWFVKVPPGDLQSPDGALQGLVMIYLNNLP